VRVAMWPGGIVTSSVIDGLNVTRFLGHLITRETV
jgi:hypothetical protein